MAVTSLDGVISGMKPPEDFIKVGGTMEAAGVLHSLFYAAGRPGAATASADGLAGAALTTYAGQIPFTNPSSGNSYLARLEGSGSQIGTLMLLDRLWHNASIVVTTTTGQTINSVAWPARDRDGSTNGENVLVAIEVSAAIGNNADVTNCTLTYCVDEATECLTRDEGWTTFDRLRAGDVILAYNPDTNTTRWEPISEVFVNRNYGGDMTLLKNGRFAAFVTPDHRWPVRRLRETRQRRRGPVKVFRTHSLPASEHALIRSAPHEAPAEPTHSDAFVRMVAWYITEGSLMPDRKAITLCQSESVNSQHVASIRADLGAIGARRWKDRVVETAVCEIAECGAPVKTRGKCPRHYYSWREQYVKKHGKLGRRGKARRQGLWVHEYMKRGDIVTWLLTGDGVDAIIACAPGQRKIPTMDFLASLTQSQAKMFVDTCLAGDGTPEKRLFFQHDRGRMDAFMVSAVLAGMGPSVDKRWTTCALNERSPDIHLGNMRRETAPFRGLVWCPVTTSGHWVARRHGKVFITGNTNSSGTGSRTATLAAIPALAEAGTFLIFSLQAGDTGIRSIQTLTLGTSLVSGTIHLVAFRRLAVLPITQTNVGAAVDAISSGFPRMYNNTVPFIVWLANGTTAVTVNGHLIVTQG